MINNRLIAAQVVHRVVFKQDSLEVAIADLFQHHFCPSKVQAIIKAYCFGTLRWFIQLNYIISLLLFKPLGKKHHDLLCLLCVALYELMHMRTPAYAVVNETVNTCIALRKPWAKNLINQVLQQFIDRQSKISKKITGRLDALYAHPVWLIKLLQQAWPMDWRNILNANNYQAPLFLRVNLLQTSIQAYQALLKNHQIETLAVENCPTALKLMTPCSVDQLPGFHAGLCSVQDIAGQKVPSLLKLKPGHNILDACAAPGSKTCHLLESEPGLNKIVAIDIQKSRLKKIYENIQRLKLPIHKFQLITSDATEPSHWWNEQLFDRVLLDAPCSATGVIRRHPDIKLLRQPHDIKQHSQLQLMLLTKLWPLLKADGLLLYTTCSVLPEENEHMIAHFIKTHADARVEAINIPEALLTSHGRQLLPQEQGHDGFYYALLSKKINNF